ncbi:hypothetical protein GW864_02485 [bacterium]|nr:hypothetical protein [bacterium]
MRKVLVIVSNIPNPVKCVIMLSRQKTASTYGIVNELTIASIVFAMIQEILVTRLSVEEAMIEPKASPSIIFLVLQYGIAVMSIIAIISRVVIIVSPALVSKTKNIVFSINNI